jgi:hypothetical protein
MAVFKQRIPVNAERRFLARLVNSGGHASADARQVRPKRVYKRCDTIVQPNSLFYGG